MIWHCGFDRLWKTAIIHGLRLKGKFKVYKDCNAPKARKSFKTGKVEVKNLVKELI
jgi:hypothetical protein